VRDDSAFLKQLDDDPEDLATLLVYADWLEDNGASDRAEFLRRQHRVLQLRHRQRGFTDSSRLLLGLGIGLDAGWVSVVSRPRLTGTCWKGPESDGNFVIWRFLPEGVLNYTDDGGTYQNGTWRQIGNAVWIEINRHYADLEGFIGGDSISGKAKNVTGRAWTWKAKRTTDPEDCDPGDPDTNVYDDHLQQ
jgi:uncharacterized protein (TIGR02996 family)